MPTNIVRFEWLAYLSLIVGLLGDWLSKTTVAETGILTLAISTGIMVLVVIAVIYLAARQRQNWARWVYAVIAALSIATTILTAWSQLRSEPFATALNVASGLLDVAAVYFVFTGDAGSWFKPGRDASGAAAGM